MERSRTMKKMGYGDGTVPNNRKRGNREWNGPEQWKKWDTGMEWSRTMEKMGYGNETVPKNGENGHQELKGPEQWNENGN